MSSGSPSAAEPSDTSVSTELSPSCAVGAACDDGDSCTLDDRCSLAGCAGTPLPCDDGNPCTADTCADARCVFAPLDPGACVDDCLVAPSCLAGRCAGSPLACDDGLVCTADLCVRGLGCTSTPIPGPCDDGNPCTSGDQCSAGDCAGAPLADGTTCDDGVACTAGSVCLAGQCVNGLPQPCPAAGECVVATCDPLLGCVSQPADDGAPCTSAPVGPCRATGRCEAGSCVAPPLPDSSVCVAGTACQPAWRCDAGVCAPAMPTAAGTACDPGSACVTGTSCDGAGACAGGELLECDDGNPCTADGCDQAQGCLHKPIGQQVPCVAACGQLGVCEAGACSAPDPCAGLGGPCELWTCADGDVCTYAGPRPDGADCGTFCVPATCEQAVCVAQQPPECWAQCQIRTCDPTLGCVTVGPLNGYCNADDDACTLLDQCSAGVCQPGESCDDLEPCTLDSCSAGTCKHEWDVACPAEADCTDGLDDNHNTAADCLDLSCERSHPHCLGVVSAPAEVPPGLGLGLASAEGLGGAFHVDGDALVAGPLVWDGVTMARTSATLCCFETSPDADLWLLFTEAVEGLPGYAQGCPSGDGVEVRRTVSVELPFSTATGVPLDAVINYDLSDTPCGAPMARALRLKQAQLGSMSAGRFRLRFMASVLGGAWSGGSWRVTELRLVDLAGCVAAGLCEP